MVAAFRSRLEREGWAVEAEVDFCDLLAEKNGARLYVEAKGRTTSPGLDIDTMYGQVLRRMPIEEDLNARFAVVVPDRALAAALRVGERVRRLLRIEVYAVDEKDAVSGPHE